MTIETSSWLAQIEYVYLKAGHSPPRTIFHTALPINQQIKKDFLAKKMSFHFLNFCINVYIWQNGQGWSLSISYMMSGSLHKYDRYGSISSSSLIQLFVLSRSCSNSYSHQMNVHCREKICSSTISGSLLLIFFRSIIAWLHEEDNNMFFNAVILTKQCIRMEL